MERNITDVVDSMAVLSSEQTELSPITNENRLATLSDGTLDKVLTAIDKIENFIVCVKQEALYRAINQHTKFTNYTLHKGRAMRSFTNEEVVAGLLNGMGVEPYTKRFRGVSNIEKEIGSEKMQALAPYIVTVVNEPMLVRNK